MTTTPRAAAVYARISSDQAGEGLGVARQVEDCRRLAESRGWVVAEEYVDNDVSAYAGKTRVAYQRMLADLEAGARDAVIVYNLDRLTRQPIQLEEFAALCERAGVRQVATVTADIDLGNDDGLFMARIFAAFAAKESARKAARIRRKHQQLAEEGKPNGGHRRPFGYEPDRVSVVPGEAEIIRTLVGRFLAGESLRSLAEWLNEEGVPGTTGAEWRTPTLRSILRSPRIAGLREHQGKVVGPAVWEGIISEEDHRRVHARMAERAASGRRTPQRYALSGLLRCGKCGHTLYSSRRETTRRYVCLRGPDHGGCGRLTVVADPVERLIADAVIFRLDTPELADALTGRAGQDQRGADLVEQIAADQALLDELAQAYAATAVTMREWMTAKKPIEGRMEATQRSLGRMTRSDALTGLVGQGQALRGAWEGMNLDRQHAIIAAVLDHAVIAPGVAGARSLDPARVQPVWRL